MHTTCVVSIAAATSVAAACKESKGDASLASGRHHTGDDRRCDGRAGDRLVYSPYYPPHDGGWHGSKDVVLIMPLAVSVCAAARGAKQS